VTRESAVTSEVTRLAQRLVRARSANPPGDTREAAGAVETALAGAFDVTRLEPEPGFVSIVGSHSFPRPGRTLILCGHLDVVPADESAAGGWTRDPWAAEINGGWLYGRGSLDMKGALAGMIDAARRTVADEAALRGRIVVAAVADEECGGRRGAGALVKEAVTAADGVIIGEPGDGAVCIGHRGMCFVEATVRGKATHASTGGGVNAVMSMVRVLGALEGIELTHTSDPLLGGPTIAIGTVISGGSTANVIPDLCRATIDVRKVPGMTDDSVLADLRGRLASRGVSDPVAFSITASVEPSVTDAHDPIVAVSADAYLEEFGRPPEVRGMSATTDGWWFRNRRGIPTVTALGPGKIADCHTVDERVSIAELESYARIYAGIIRRFLSADGPDVVGS
jgi:succinyl-diaminopimelate desuccinylase